MINLDGLGRKKIACLIIHLCINAGKQRIIRKTNYLVHSSSNQINCRAQFVFTYPSICITRDKRGTNGVQPASVVCFQGPVVQKQVSLSWVKVKSKASFPVGSLLTSSILLSSETQTCRNT